MKLFVRAMGLLVLVVTVAFVWGVSSGTPNEEGKTDFDRFLDRTYKTEWCSRCGEYHNPWESCPDGQPDPTGNRIYKTRTRGSSK